MAPPAWVTYRSVGMIVEGKMDRFMRMAKVEGTPANPGTSLSTISLITALGRRTGC
jgi:hypothetical protein